MCANDVGVPGQGTALKGQLRRSLAEVEGFQIG